MCETRKSLVIGELSTRILIGIVNLYTIISNGTIMLTQNELQKYLINTKLCLLIDLYNNDFKEAANLYIKFGFKNPYLTNVNVFGYSYNNIYVGLIKENMIEFPTKEEREEVFSEIIYIFNENKKCFETNDVCSLNTFIEEKLILWLLRLPYSTSNYDPSKKISQNIFSGAFVLDNFSLNNGYKWQLKLDYSELNKNGSKIQSINVDEFSKILKDIPSRTTSISNIITNLGNVALNYPHLLMNGIIELDKHFSDFKAYVDSFLNYSNDVLKKIDHSKNSFFLDEKKSIDGIITFVSHTYESINKNPLFSFPLGEDFAIFLNSFITYETISTFIICLKGIFIISFSKDMCITANIQNLKNKIEKCSIEEKNNLFKYITGQFDITSGIPPSETDYIVAINKIICGLISPIPIFSCSFKSWDQLVNKDDILIFYPKYNEQCYTNLPVRNIISELHTYKGQKIPNIRSDNIVYPDSL